MHGAFTSQLLARHLQNESLELCARQIFADVLQPLREVFAHAILSALLTLQIETKGAEDRLTIGHAPRLHRKYHLASHGRGGVAERRGKRMGAGYGSAASPDAPTAIVQTARLQPNRRVQFHLISGK